MLSRRSFWVAALLAASVVTVLASGSRAEARPAGGLVAGAPLSSGTVGPGSGGPGAAGAVGAAGPAAAGAAGAAGAAAANDPSGHQPAEGPQLVDDPSPDRMQDRGSRCPSGAPVRRYDVVALAVDLPLNRYGDHDPQGRMYALASDVARVQAQERAVAVSRAGSGPVAVTAGLQGDAIQPLTLRVHPGDCLRLSLRDELPGEPATVHLHGAALRVLPTDRPAIATEPSAVARPGRTVRYEWAVPAGEPTGSHYFHSHGDERNQTEHGLYGAVVVEPSGSRWLDPRSGWPEDSGWDAVVVRPDGSSFREFALFYAEVGDEPYQPLDRTGQQVPLVDDLTGTYKPAARALNYRSEPFLDRLALAQKVTGHYDESGAYSSYAFGDPATPMLRSYLGDPVVQRVIHAGSEVLHVHHVHGGSIRWRRQPDEGGTGATLGLDKNPPLLPGPSERTDAQTIGPGETFDVVDECGSGGCQASVGDFLYHCHIAQHYFAGMWGLWRVYGTLQDGPHSTDALPPLPELPDRTGRAPAAVPASALVGRTVVAAGRRVTFTPAALAAWLCRVLPPPGRAVPGHAGVWNWKRSGLDVLGEPEDTRSWPGYSSPAPGRRPEVLFDPRSGRPAYPFLRPHLAVRPPFAPGHGPAPYLDPPASAAVAAPGADGRESLCPRGTSVQPLPLEAVQVPVTLSPRTGAVDDHGELYVRTADLTRLASDPGLRRPLVVRARAQRDCVDVTLTSALNDDPESHEVSKVDMHVHFVQFDVQGSDGVVAGFNYEQSVRPWRLNALPLDRPAAAGTHILDLAQPPDWQPMETVALGPERPAGPEVARVLSVSGTRVTLDAPLAQAHPAGEPVTTEFVRYRWYPDAQTGTSYFHDHVNALSSWRHGLFGALIVEPPDADWTDPHTGAPVTSGALADVHTRRPVSVDVSKPFREYVALLQDDNPFTAVSHSTGGSLNLRTDPLDDRTGAAGAGSPPAGGPPAGPFTTSPQWPLGTDRIDAYLGDPVVIRTLVGGTNEVHSLFVDGHWFRREPWSRTSAPVAAVHVGISERMDLVLPAAGGPQRRPGDYLFGDGRTSKLREGVWGILHVRPGPAGPGLRPLTRAPVPAAASGSVCPAAAAVRRVDLTATPLALPMLNGLTGAAYVPTADLARVRADPTSARPLVLHVGVGDCLQLTLRDALAGRVSIHAALLAADPARSGLAVGAEPDSTVAPGGTGTYQLYASPQVGPCVALVLDGADPLHGPASGLYGAVVVTAAGSRYLDAGTGRELPPGAPGDQVVVAPPGRPGYRDDTVFFHDSDGELGTHQMPYRHVVLGVQALSYAAAPLADRQDVGADPAGLQRSDLHGDPPTPVLRATAGDPLQLHVLAPVSEQGQVFSLEGHEWPLEPGRRGSSLVSAISLAARETITAIPLGGAGGVEHLPGDYVYGDHRGPYADAGMWGLLRVYPRSATPLHPLPCRGCGHPDLLLGSLVLPPALLGLILLIRWRRRRVAV